MSAAAAAGDGSRAPRTAHTAEAKVFCVVAGGGTGGHLLPGIATARALVARGRGAGEIHFVVSQRPLDSSLVRDAGFSCTALPGRGLERRLTLRNLGAVAGLVRAQIKALGLVRRMHPEVVLVLGGYASLACAMAAALARRPIIVAEQNARAGAANKVAGWFARSCAVPFASTDLPRKVVVGNPVRDEVLAVDRTRDREAARRELGIPRDRTLVLAFAGSLGAGSINAAVADLANRWSSRADVAIRHVVGDRDWVQEGEQVQVGDEDGLLYQQVRYEQHMELALAAADVAVCRAGGTTVAELAAVGLPSVLVPLPIAPRDHQTANAVELVQAGAAVLVPDDELDGERLEAELSAMLAEPAKLAAMASAASALGRRDAAERVADLLEEVAR